MNVEEIKIGTPVIYWSIIKDNGKKIGPKKTKITSDVWTLGHGDIVCKVEGVSGGVLISHLDTITPGSLMAAKLAGLTDVSDEDIKSESEKFFKDRGINAEFSKV